MRESERNFMLLRDLAKGTGLYVKRTYDFDGDLIEGHYTLMRGDYIAMAGDCEDILAVIDKHKRTDP